jgi:hypothetical protein
MVAGRRLAMNSVHGWFSDNTVWIEFIIATVLLWLLMMTAIHELDLRSAALCGLSAKYVMLSLAPEEHA